MDLLITLIWYQVAIVSPWTVSSVAVGGTERFVLDLATSLKNLGNDVDIYMLSGKTETVEGINFINLKFLGNDDYIDEYALSNLFGDFSSEESYQKIANRLEEMIDSSKYDFIQLNSQLFLKAFIGTSRIFTIHTNPFEYKLGFGEKSFNCMLKIMKKQAMIPSTYFIAPSKYYSLEYKKLTGIKINIIPHAIDLKRLVCKKSKIQICNELNLNNSLKKILLPSRLEPIQKQPMLFMKAFAKMSLGIKSQFQVICTGADEQYIKYKDEIQSFCCDNGINLKITRFNSMADAYEIADLVILPSQSESFGYSALESLSLGIPTILNSIPTYLEIANNSQNNYFFSNSIESLEKQLKNVISSSLTRKLQTNSWQKQYDILLFGQKYLDVILLRNAR